MIYLKSTPKTIEDLFFDMVIKHKPTYSDKECTQIQTSQGRRRSRVDFRLAAKTYFPKMKSTEITKLMNRASDTNLIYNDFCYTIRRKTLVSRSCMTTKEECKKHLNEENLFEDQAEVRARTFT